MRFEDITGGRGYEVIVGSANYHRERAAAFIRRLVQQCRAAGDRAAYNFATTYSLNRGKGSEHEFLPFIQASVLGNRLYRSAPDHHFGAIGAWHKCNRPKRAGNGTHRRAGA